MFYVRIFVWCFCGWVFLLGILRFCVWFFFTFIALVNLHFSNYSESYNIPNFQFLLATFPATQ